MPENRRGLVTPIFSQVSIRRLRRHSTREFRWSSRRPLGRGRTSGCRRRGSGRPCSRGPRPRGPGSRSGSRCASRCRCRRPGRAATTRCTGRRPRRPSGGRRRPSRGPARPCRRGLRSRRRARRRSGRSRRAPGEEAGVLLVAPPVLDVEREVADVEVAEDDGELGLGGEGAEARGHRVEEVVLRDLARGVDLPRVDVRGDDREPPPADLEVGLEPAAGGVGLVADAQAVLDRRAGPSVDPARDDDPRAAFRERGVVEHVPPPSPSSVRTSEVSARTSWIARTSTSREASQSPMPLR